MPPTQKRSKTSARERASHFAIKMPNLHKCENCSKAKLPHHACPSCGAYRGKNAITAKTQSIKT